MLFRSSPATTEIYTTTDTLSLHDALPIFPGVVVGICTLAGISLAHAIRPGLPAELVGIALSAGSATALVLLAFLPYYGIDQLWLHVLLTALVPAALCRYAAR